ncbi:MAG: hypothetical protein L6Q35_06575 [Phycisphaerales bacterium]|nr:hypothetical protein [Phycisphaerales bacterium]
MKRHAALVAAAVGLSLVGGCAMSREDKLRARSDKIADALIDERDRVLNSTAPDLQRDARLARLNTLRTTLSAINVGLGSARYLPEDRRALAYDVIDEAYTTIEWNIPLGPSDQLKPMPAEFQNGQLLFR